MSDSPRSSHAVPDQSAPAGGVGMVKVTGLDGADVLVQPVDAVGEKVETAGIPRREASMRRMEHPSELFEVGQEINAAVAAELTDNKKAPGMTHKTRDTAFDDCDPRADTESPAEAVG